MAIVKQTFQKGSGFYGGTDPDLLNYLKTQGVDMTNNQRYSGDPTSVYYETGKSGRFLGGSDQDAWIAQERAASMPGGSLSGILGGLGGALGGAGGGTGGAGGAGGGLPSGQLTADEKQARAAAFSGAREQAGQTSAAALRSLQDLYAGQGLSGSTMEAAAAGREIGRGQAGVTQFTRDQMMQDLKRAQEQATMQYQGGITQRGQDMGFLQALLSMMGGGGTSTTTSNYSGQLY